MKRTFLLPAAAMIFAAATPVAAQTTDLSAHHPADAQATKAAGQELTDGEVRKIDMET